MANGASDELPLGIPPASERRGFGHGPLDPDTNPDGIASRCPPGPLPGTPVPTLVLLYHPDLRRIGEACCLGGLAVGRPANLSRSEPVFYTPTCQLTDSLGDARISRTPVVLQMDAEGTLELSFDRDRVRLSVDGVDCASGQRIDANQLAHGVVLNLQDAVLLWLGWLARTDPLRPDHGMIGTSPAMVRLRDDIDAVSRHHTPVLIRGETGVGKELVARAVHAASRRAARQFLAVNMAAVAPSAAASELFGHKRGAFTDAVNSHDGYFGAAHTGTLFLDEIGETPAAVQPLLLRALNDGQIQPVGGTLHAVDVRLIAATDADLEREVTLGRFRDALLHRIAAWTIDVPPLRQRRETIPVIFIHYLARQLADLGASQRLLPPELHDPPWLSLRQMRELMDYPWPGNVRQLRNVASEMAIRSFFRPAAELPTSLNRPLPLRRKAPSGGHELPDRRAPSGGHERREPSAPGGFRDLGDLETPLSGPRGFDPTRSTGAFEVARTAPGRLSDEEVVSALEAANFNISATARSLRIAKNSLIARMATIARLPRAADLDRSAIDTALAMHGGSFLAAARELRVGEHALRLRLAELQALARGDEGRSGD